MHLLSFAISARNVHVPIIPTKVLFRIGGETSAIGGGYPPFPSVSIPAMGPNTTGSIRVHIVGQAQLVPVP